jgi:hypothetical protein
MKPVRHDLTRMGLGIITLLGLSACGGGVSATTGEATASMATPTQVVATAALAATR